MTNSKAVSRDVQNEQNNFIPSGNVLYFISFLLPVFVLIAIYAARGIYPFGDQMYLRSDMYHQYAPFYSELMDKLKNGESLTYTWNIGLGVNFVSLYAYYLSSPVNWLLGLFPQNHLPEIMSIFIGLKLAFASLNFSIYLSKKYNSKSITISLFGLFYALSGYTAAFSWNIMWLDCIMIFPIIIMGMEKLMKENNGLLYCLSLGFCILSNYYISIMVCFFLVIYFFVLYFTLEKRKLSIFIKKGLIFGGYSLLAGGLAAVLLFPEIYTLSLTASGNVNFPSTLTSYFSISEMLIRHLMDVPVSIGLDHLPNIYCGVAVFLLFPLYIMNKNTSTRKKVMFTAVLFIFLTSFSFNIPNFIWHGFHFPNSLPCRQSFIYVFILLAMCYEAFKDLNQFKDKQLTTALWIAIAFLLIVEKIYVGDDFDFKIVYISGFFIAFYMLLMYLYRRKRIASHILVFLLFASVIAECTLNLESTGYSTTGRNAYLSDNEAITSLTDEISENDTTFYRYAKYSGYRSKNDTAWHHINGVSLFSSTANAGVGNFLGSFGCEHSTNAYSYTGATPLTAAMLSVKYVLSKSDMVESDLLSLVSSEGNVRVYENLYTLPLAYMVPANLETDLNTNLSNPFEVQNSFLDITTNYSDVFSQIPTEQDGASIIITPSEDQNIYLFVTSTDTSKINVEIGGNQTSYKDLKRDYIVDLGKCTEGETITVTAEDNDSFSLMAYTINSDDFIDAINTLKISGIDLKVHTNTYLEGTITAYEDGVMFTSIPYDEGWAVYVDGEKVEYTAFDDAFIAVPLTEGTHTISMDYVPCGFSFGMLVSGICAAIILLILIIRSIRSKKKGIEASEVTFDIPVTAPVAEPVKENITNNMSAQENIIKSADTQQKENFKNHTLPIGNIMENVAEKADTKEISNKDLNENPNVTPNPNLNGNQNGALNDNTKENTAQNTVDEKKNYDDFEPITQELTPDDLILPKKEGK